MDDFTAEDFGHGAPILIGYFAVLVDCRGVFGRGDLGCRQGLQRIFLNLGIADFTQYLN